MALEIGEFVLAIDGSGLPSKDLIGGKAWSIARMSALGLSVPPAVVITTRACAHFLQTGRWPDTLEAEIGEGLRWLEEQTGRIFGGSERPLLISVRSGAPISMPGMMDTVLNLGINDHTENALGRECGDPAFARDTHRRFLDLYANIVLRQQVELDEEGTPTSWRATIGTVSSRPVTGDVNEELKAAVDAVFQSWNSRRAKKYRQHHGIPDALGTAVTLQAMVFGNLDEMSGTGVLFSRNPLTGENLPYGEFMHRAQGEDIVSGKRTPLPLDALLAQQPGVHSELLAAARRLEEDAGDAQDIEFTLERGKLFLLQTRAAKRAPLAAVRIAVEMVDAGVITTAEALSRISAEQVRVILSPRLSDDAVATQAVATGEAASPGVGVGIVVLESDEAEDRARQGESVILARSTTSPDDLHGMIAAKAIITETGGSTSHAAVVGRALGRPCVVGCGSGALQGLAGQVVTVDGGAGQIFLGALPVVTPSAPESPLLRRVLEWAAAVCPVEITDDPSAMEGAIDFDAAAGEYEPLLAHLQSGATVSGELFARDDAAVRKVLDAGVGVIVTSPVLPAVITAAQHAAVTPDLESEPYAEA